MANTKAVAEKFYNVTFFELCHRTIVLNSGQEFSMGLFRTHRKFGGLLALFALVVQFYLSFGHIHPEDIYGPAEVTLQAGAQIALPAAQAMRAIPADQTLGHADELCPICEAVYFLATSSVPAAPQVAPVTFAMRSVEHLSGIEALVIAPRRAPFQSRAPPPA
jgi:hypothetical protein